MQGVKRLSRLKRSVMTSALERDLTNDALVAYLEADEKLQPLVSCLTDTSVDGVEHAFRGGVARHSATSQD